MDIYLYCGLILGFFGVFLAIYSILQKEESSIARFKKEFISPRGGKEGKAKQLHRFLAPFVVITKRWDGPRCDKLRRRLVNAGSPFTVPEFLALKLFSVFVACGVCLIFIPMFIKGNILIFLLISFAFGLIVPDLWINGRLKKRHLQIARDLPAVIDLLNLCVGAGMDFMQATKRVIENFRRCYLVDELEELNKDISMGASRHEALENLAWRINLLEISSFVRTLVQTDKVGAPIKEALSIQSEEIRIRRFQRGEEQAMKAPIKLLFPLLIFILPVVMAIVAGPIILNFIGAKGLGAF